MISIRSIAKQFGPVAVLKDISVEIVDGQFVVLFGPSGCGKTTMLRILSTLEHPDSGSVVVDGVVAHHDADGYRQKISFVWQDPRLLPWRSALGNVMLPLELRGGLSKDEIMARARDALDFVGILQSSGLLPRHLSGGMRQRVNLARALALDTEIMLMDEPLANLNEVTDKQVLMRDFQKLWEIKRKTILYVTHSLDESIYLADKIVVCSDKPTVVLSEEPISMPRPRDMNSPDAKQIRENITNLLGTRMI